MSLILDALKRAERERKLGQAPDALNEIPGAPPPPPGPPPRRRWLLAGAAVAVLALLVFAWFRQAGDAVPATAVVAAVPVETPAEPIAAALPPPQPAAEPVVAADPVVSAQIEDDSAIESLDDLTGDPAEPMADDIEDASDLLAADAAPVAAPAPVAPGPTLYTPSQPPVTLPAEPVPAAPPPAPAKASAAPKPAPKTAVVAAAPAKPSLPKPAPAPAPAPTPAPAPVVAPPASGPLVLPAPPPFGSVAESDQVRAQPPGPIVRFGADGKTDVIPIQSPSEPVAAAASDTPSPADAPAAAAATSAPVAAEAPAPARIEPAAPAPAAPPPAPAPVARRSPPPPAASTIGLRRLRDMPAAYRAEFPALSVDVHVYNADPARRFLLVNGKRYGEGTVLAEGPRIVEIVSDGMIVEWRNERIVYTISR